MVFLWCLNGPILASVPKAYINPYFRNWHLYEDDLASTFAFGCSLRSSCYQAACYRKHTKIPVPIKPSNVPKFNYSSNNISWRTSSFSMTIARILNPNVWNGSSLLLSQQFSHWFLGQRSVCSQERFLQTCHYILLSRSILESNSIFNAMFEHPTRLC